jgi:hypothetical protein
LYIGYAVGRALVAYADTDGAQRGWNGVRLQWYGEERYYGPGTWNQIAIELVRKAKLGDRATARPVTAAKTLLNKEFKPAILTPPFPSYVSGHAAFSGAAAEILGAYLPHERQELARMAEEAAMSRLLGGIHFRHDNEDGLALGRAVARKVLEKYRD